MKKRKILFIEDDRIARKVGFLFLTQLSCEVEVVSNAAEALEHINQNRYDVIFVDLGLPDMNGFILAEKIRSSELNAASYIVILTAHGNDDYMKKAKLVGANDFVVKPLSLEKSAEIIEVLA